MLLVLFELCADIVFLMRRERCSQKQAVALGTSVISVLFRAALVNQEDFRWSVRGAPPSRSARLRSIRRMSARPQRSGAESPMAPNMGVSAGV